MPSTLLCFGRCELDVGARELRVDGVARSLEPRAFDLLAYLVRQRGKVVSKDELLDQVWRDRIVSVGVVARAVRTVRQAIDDAVEPAPIQTAHRVGYCFAAPVEERTSQPAPAATATPLEVALLPADEPGLPARRTPGLQALVANALALDRRLLPMSADAVAAALRALPAGAGLPEQVEALRGPQAQREVVQTRIFAGPAGYRLEYRLLSAPGGAEGSVSAADPTRVARAFARRLLEHLRPGPSAGTAASADHDAWAMQLFARAMQACYHGQWRHAQRLLHVVTDLQPDCAEAWHELQRVQEHADRGPEAALARH